MQGSFPTANTVDRLKTIAAKFWKCLQNRPFAIIGVCVGLMVLACIIATQIVQHETVEDIDKRVGNVEKQENSRPCLGLNTHQCAVKILSALSEDELQAILNARAQKNKK